MPIDTYNRRDVQRKLRACDSPKVLAWPTGNGATALPEILSESTYTGLATLKPNDTPILGTDIYFYRPGADEKMVALEFCSATGADGETQVWELGLYAMPFRTSQTVWRGWKNIGTVNFTLTLGTRTLASQTDDPWTGVQTFSSATLRWADTYAESTNDFSNSTAGFYQVFPMGFGAANKSGRVCVDLTFASLLAIRLVTKAASSTAELVGLYTEIN